MIIIRVDYHQSLPQIAFMHRETGKCGERRLSHSDGKAEKFYRELKRRGVSMRWGCLVGTWPQTGARNKAS